MNRERTRQRGIGGGIIPNVFFDFTGSALDARLTLVATSLATMYDASGYMTFRPNNLLLNSATLSTQNVTTTAAQPYIISFKGTGSVALSGTATATVNGTGADDRVFLKFTATAGTLTCTVTGTVTEAQIEAVTYETAPRTYNPTTGAAYYGPRFDYDPAHGQSGALLLLETARSNLVTAPITLNAASWTISNVTRTLSAELGPDNYNAAWFITATSAGGWIRALPQSTTATGRNISVFLRRKTGTGTITLRAGDQTVECGSVPSTGWTRYNVDVLSQSATYTVVSNVVTITSTAHGLVSGDRIRFVPTSGTATAGGTLDITVIDANTFTFAQTTADTSGSALIIAQTLRIIMGSINDEVYIWGAQYENARGATSFMPANGAAFVRTAEYLSCDSTNFSSWFTLTGSYTCEFVPVFSVTSVRSNSAVTSFSEGATTNYWGGGYASAASSAFVTYGPTITTIKPSQVNQNTLYKYGQSISYTGGTFGFGSVLNKFSGEAVVPTSPSSLIPVADRMGINIGIGAISGGGAMWYKGFAFYNRALSQAELEVLVP